MVRASDIGSWTFCNRSWWLANVQKVPHQNPNQLAFGDSMHERHGRNLKLAGIAQQLGLFLLAIAMLMAAGLILWFLYF